MTSRRQKRQQVRLGIDQVSATLDREDDMPKQNLNLLTDRERLAFERLKALASADGTWNLRLLDDMQLDLARALHRKATDQINLDSPISPDDRADCRYLAKIDQENFDYENISPLG